MHILLVWPKYYTTYPPLGLLKLSSWRKSLGDTTELVRPPQPASRPPDLIYITSLFSYSWKPVHKAVRCYRKLYPSARIELGGIYASLMPEHAATSGANHVHIGLVPEAEAFLPDYDILSSVLPGWNSSLVFSSRGCIRRCPFCAVPTLEPRFTALPSIEHLVVPEHKQIVLWDNNFLASPYAENIIRELQRLSREVDFNQGLDARLMTPQIAKKLRSLNIPLLRLAYDRTVYREQIRQAIAYLIEAGFKPRKIIVYVMHNFQDTPDDFYRRVRDLLEWGVVAYPMRYEPLDSLRKGQFVERGWTAEELEMVAQARRVLGTHGAFPPYEGLVQKFIRATGFTEAFALRPRKVRAL